MALKQTRMMKTQTKSSSTCFSLLFQKPTDIIYRPPNDLAECVKGYKYIAAHVPAFKKDMENFKDDEMGQLGDLIKLVSLQQISCAYMLLKIRLQVTEHAQATRTSDSGKIKPKIIGYLGRNINVDLIQPPIPAIASKAMRGFNHPMIARMLCPRHLRDKFDANPK